MTLLLVSFLAGIVTVAAPCILPLLPVIVGGTIVSNPSSSNIRRPFIIALSLAASVIVFTLLLKGTTALLGVPQAVWQIISGGIVFMFGLQLLMPAVWERVSAGLNLQSKSQALLGQVRERSDWKSSVVLGAALGPIFNSCSPTYALIVAAILPVSFTQGLIYLTAYALGLAMTLLLIAMLGQRITRKMTWLANPHGAFRRTIGGLFILVGIAIIGGFDKQIQTFALEHGWYNGYIELEKLFETD